MTWRRAFQDAMASGVDGTRRAFTLIELLVVIGIIAILIAILMPALARARKQALTVSCGSNQRQVAYAGIAYCNDWQEQLPTPNGAVDSIPHALNRYPRLPIVGFDTTTVVAPADYDISGFGAGLGGWAYMLRDYLKNDKAIVVCPDGWFDLGGTFTKYASASSPPDVTASDLALFPSRDTIRPRPGICYNWLPHRAVVRGMPPNCPLSCPAQMTDTARDVARTASDLPDLLVSTDIIVWTCNWAVCQQCIVGNHIATGLRRMSYRDAEAAENLPPFDACKPNATNPAHLPLGSNLTRLDCRVTWKPFQDIDMFRWAWSNDLAAVKVWHVW